MPGTDRLRVALGDGHQYRILGSMYAFTKSMIRLASDDDEREHDDDSLHRRVVAVPEVVEQASWPMPGQLNVVSVSTAPDRSSATVRPTTVITGTSAFLKRVVVHDRVLVDPASPGGLDVVVLHRADDVDPDEADEHAGRDETERDRGQDQVLDHVDERIPVAAR